MLYFIFKAAFSGVIIALISTVSKRYPGVGALIASLPLISMLGMIWLWRDRPDIATMAAHAQATFWFVLPSPAHVFGYTAMLREGVGFWISLVTGCLLTVVLYSLLVWLGPRLGIRLSPFEPERERNAHPVGTHQTSGRKRLHAQRPAVS